LNFSLLIGAGYWKHTEFLREMQGTTLRAVVYAWNACLISPANFMRVALIGGRH